MKKDLVIGDKAPEIKLKNQNEEIIVMSELKENIILFFYPKDNTPGCTTEAKEFTKYISQFNDNDFAVIGISKDSTEKHRNFIQKHKLKVDLLSDKDRNVCERYGVWKEKNMYGKIFMGIERATFIINQDKNILNIWRKVKVKDHVKEVLSEVKKI